MRFQKHFRFSVLIWVLAVIPKRLIGKIMGFFFEIPLPFPINVWIIGCFARLVGADLGAAGKPLAQYRTLCEFFIRELKPGLRPTTEDPDALCSPADSLLRRVGAIENALLTQTKGWRYSLVELLKAEEADYFDGGTELNFYLSPRDYHHVHSPLDGVITRAAYIRGSLWPVNNWSLNRVKNLFARNERLVVYIRRKDKEIAVVLVGALNVGHLVAAFDDTLVGSAESLLVHHYNPPIPVKAGQKIGTFKIGSSVILLLPKGELTSCTVIEGKKVCFGEKLGSLSQ